MNMETDLSISKEQLLEIFDKLNSKQFPVVYQAKIFNLQNKYDIYLKEQNLPYFNKKGKLLGYGKGLVYTFVKNSTHKHLISVDRKEHILRSLGDKFILINEYSKEKRLYFDNIIEYYTYEFLYVTSKIPISINKSL